MGLVPELASTRLLAERVGFGRASDLCLSGRLIRGDEAHAIGLADRLVPVPTSSSTPRVEVAASYAANPAPQLRMIKHLLTANAVESDLAAVQRAEHEYLAECWASPQHAEAVQAFTREASAGLHPLRRARLSTGVSSGGYLEVDEVVVDDVVDAVVDAVAGVLVGGHDDEPAVLQRVGHRPRARRAASPRRRSCRSRRSGRRRRR